MPPKPPRESVWALGARTVKQAERESGLSRQELWLLMQEGVLVWFAHGGRGTRLIAWQSVVDYLARQHAAFAKERRAHPGQHRRLPGAGSAGARTADSPPFEE